MTRETEVVPIYREDLDQEVKVTSCGYMVKGNDECVSFYFDVSERAWVEASSYTEEGFPCVYLMGKDSTKDMLEVAFPEFKGWSFWASSGGKSIGICLTREVE